MNSQNGIDKLREGISLKNKIDFNWGEECIYKADYKKVISLYRESIKLNNEHAYYYLFHLYCTRMKNSTVKSIKKSHKDLENYYLDSINNGTNKNKSLCYFKLANIFTFQNFFYFIDNDFEIEIHELIDIDSKIKTIIHRSFSSFYKIDDNFIKVFNLPGKNNFGSVIEDKFTKYSNLALDYCEDINLKIKILFCKVYYLSLNTGSYILSDLIADKDIEGLKEKLIIIQKIQYSLNQIINLSTRDLNDKNMDIYNQSLELLSDINTNLISYNNEIGDMDVITSSIKKLDKLNTNIKINKKKLYRENNDTFNKYKKQNISNDRNLINKDNKKLTNLITKKIKNNDHEDENEINQLYAAIDFETANKDRNSACAVGLSIFTKKQIISSDYYLIKPPINNFEFTHIHNITWDDVKNKKTFNYIWNIILPKLNNIKFIAAHNSAFDKSVLNATCDHYGINNPNLNFVCTVKLSRKLWPKLINHKLNTVSNFLKIPLKHHHAKSDTEACAKIIIKAFEKNWTF